MQKKTSKLHREPLSHYLRLASDIMSFHPVNRNGWWIKFSTFKSHNILLLFTSMYTGQTVVRYFDDEDDAVKFINYIIECDPTEELVA